MRCKLMEIRDPKPAKFYKVMYAKGQALAPWHTFMIFFGPGLKRDIVEMAINDSKTYIQAIVVRPSM